MSSTELDILQAGTFSEPYRDHIHARFVVDGGSLVYIYVIWTPRLCSITRTWKLPKPYWSEDEICLGEERSPDGNYYDNRGRYLIEREDVKVSGFTWREVATCLLHFLGRRLTSEQVQELEGWIRQLS